jgi:hypothetical protein
MAMRITTVLAGLAALLVAFTVLSWATRTNPSAGAPAMPSAAAETPDPTQPNKDGIYTINPFTPAENGPQPKVEIESKSFTFDRIAVGGKDMHQFSVKNAGDAPLKLAVGPRTCKCTIGKLGTEEIAPGESATIEMEWHPQAPAEMFAQVATIWTNDPLLPKLDLEVRGKVVPPFITIPEGTWTVGVLSEGQPSKVSGKILAMLDPAFELLDVKTSADYVQVSQRRLSEEEVKPMGGLAGYELTCEVHPTMAVGQFNEQVTITTNLEDAPEFTFNIQGSRMGPYNIVGPGWFQGNQSLDLGRFVAAEGKTVSLSVFSPATETPLEFTAVDVEPPILTVTLTRDEAFGASGSRQRFLMTVAAPPGITPGRWTQESAVRVTLHSNHPEAPVATFQISLQAD